MSADRLLALAALAIAVAGLGLAPGSSSGCAACAAPRAPCSRAPSRRSGRVRGRHAGAPGARRAARRRARRRSSRRPASDVAGALQRIGLQRFDAYDGAEGLQSTALALLDGRGDGVVVSAIQDSDSARVYVKRVQAGAAADVALGPEEQAAVAAAQRAN